MEKQEPHTELELITSLAGTVAKVQGELDDQEKRLDLYGMALVKVFEVLLKAGIIQARDVPDLGPGKAN